MMVFRIPVGRHFHFFFLNSPCKRHKKLHLQALRKGDYGKKMNACIVTRDTMAVMYQRRGMGFHTVVLLGSYRLPLLPEGRAGRG